MVVYMPKKIFQPLINFYFQTNISLQSMENFKQGFYRNILITFFYFGDLRFFDTN
jgi:hypothetical protein